MASGRQQQFGLLFSEALGRFPYPGMSSTDKASLPKCLLNQLRSPKLYLVPGLYGVWMAAQWPLNDWGWVWMPGSILKHLSGS